MNYLKQDNCLENLDIARILIDAKITGLVNDNKKNINTIRNTNIAFLHSKCDYKYNNLETSLIGFREIKRNEDIIVLTTIPALGDCAFLPWLRCTPVWMQCRGSMS